MIIPCQSVASHLQKCLLPLYVLVGKEVFLLEEALSLLKKTYSHKYTQHDTKIMTIEKPSDWYLLIQEACSLSLFSTQLLIEVHYEKKTLDKQTIQILTDYLKKPNPDCLIIIRGYHIAYKDYLWLKKNPNAAGLSAQILTTKDSKLWITTRLKQAKRTFEPQIVECIEYYTHNNLLATAQVLDKILLLSDCNSHINLDEVMIHLSNQSDYQVFELSQACLKRNPQELHQLFESNFKAKIDPILALWLLTQEIRLSLQLIHLTNQGYNFSDSCNQLKILSYRTHVYQNFIKNVTIDYLLQLLIFCQTTDEHFKTNQLTDPWISIEQVAFSLCLNQLMFACE